MIIQGIAPSFWGPFADRKGRRPSFIFCLLILALACLGIARTPTKDYWLLIVLRCLQAAGSASTIALCMSRHYILLTIRRLILSLSVASGVMADIIPREERGGYIGWSALGPMASAFVLQI